MNLSFRKLHLMIFLSVILFMSCKDKNLKSNVKEGKDVTTESQNYIEVVSTGMNFELINEIQSGWTTFKYINNSKDTHFFIFEKMPGTSSILPSY